MFLPELFLFRSFLLRRYYHHGQYLQMQNSDNFLIDSPSVSKLLEDFDMIKNHPPDRGNEKKSLYKLALFYYTVGEYNKSLEFLDKLMKM